MVEALGIITDRHPKGKIRERESYTIEKIGCASILIKRLSNIYRGKGAFLFSTLGAF